MPDRRSIPCPECVKENERKLAEEANIPIEEGAEEDEIIEKKPALVLQLPNWKEYSYHILEEHVTSERVVWALTCLELPLDTPLPYKRNGKKPQSEIIKITKEDVPEDLAPRLKEMTKEFKENPPQKEITKETPKMDLKPTEPKLTFAQKVVAKLFKIKT